MTPQELEQAYEAAMATAHQVASTIEHGDFKYPCGRAHVQVARTLKDKRVNPFYQYLYKRFARKEGSQIRTQHGEPYFGNYPKAYASIFNPAPGQALDDYVTVARAQLDILTKFGIEGIYVHEWID